MTLAMVHVCITQAAHGFGLVGSWNALQSSGGGLQGFTPQPIRAHLDAYAWGVVEACVLASLPAKRAVHICERAMLTPLQLLQLTLAFCRRGLCYVAVRHRKCMRMIQNL